MNTKSDQKIQLDASKLLGFSKVDNVEQNDNSKLFPKAGSKVGGKVGSKVGVKVGSKVGNKLRS